MKPPAEVISIEKKPEKPKTPFPIGRAVKTAMDWGYLLFSVMFVYFAKRENVGLPPAAAFILQAPFTVGQYCDIHAKGNGTYAYIERFVSVGITVFETVIMFSAVMIFFTSRARLNEPTETDLPKSYSAADISRLSVEISTGSNAPHYYVYTVDMENRTAKKETYSFNRGGEYQVSETISNAFSEEKAADFTEFCDEVLITKWDDFYMPEREIYDGLDEVQSFEVQYYGISRGGYRKFSLEYNDGGSDSTIMYDHAKDVPKDSSLVVSRIYGLLTKEK